MSAVNAQPPHSQSDTTADGRPTEMEDILASIRRIIADDQSRYAPFRRQSALPADEPAPQPQQPASSALREAPALPRIEDPVILAPTPVPTLPQTSAQAPVPLPQPVSHAPSPKSAAPSVDAYAAPGAQPFEEDAAIDEIASAGAAAVLRPSFGQASATSTSELRTRASSVTFPAAPIVEPSIESGMHMVQNSEPEPLVSDSVGASIEASFHELATSIFTQNTEMVEGMVRDMLRPMLKSWLDDNLPSIVERLVRAEIERVARGRKG